MERILSETLMRHVEEDVDALKTGSVRFLLKQRRSRTADPGHMYVLDRFTSDSMMGQTCEDAGRPCLATNLP